MTKTVFNPTSLSIPNVGLSNPIPDPETELEPTQPEEIKLATLPQSQPAAATTATPQTNTVQSKEKVCTHI